MAVRVSNNTRTYYTSLMITLCIIKTRVLKNVFTSYNSR